MQTVDTANRTIDAPQPAAVCPCARKGLAKSCLGAQPARDVKVGQNLFERLDHLLVTFAFPLGFFLPFREFAPDLRVVGEQLCKRSHLCSGLDEVEIRENLDEVEAELRTAMLEVMPPEERLRRLPPNERARERLLSLGPQAMTDAKLNNAQLCQLLSAADAWESLDPLDPWLAEHGQ
jgi:hypothetical protein